jgi:hypothetical protein
MILKGKPRALIQIGGQKKKYQKQNGNQFSHFSHSKNGASEGGRACYTCGSKDHLANFHRIPKTSQTNCVCATEIGDGQICTDAQSDKLSQSDQHPHDTGCNMFGDIFVEPTDTQANIKRVICSINQSRDVTPAVNKSNVFEKVKIGRETESLMAKVFANDRVIIGLIDSGAQMSILSRRCLPADYDFVQSGQILLRGPFGKEVLAQLINLPCKLLVNDKSSEMPDILITVAITDELKGNEMLISLDDYATLLEHSETCIPRVKVVNNSTLIIDEDVSHVDNEVIAMNRDINSMPDVIDTLNVSEDCDINSSNVVREYNNSGCVSSNSIVILLSPVSTIAGTEMS